MAGRNGVNREKADAFAGDDRNVGKIMGDRFAIERPLDLYWMIPFQDGARRGDCVSPIRRFFTNHKWRDLRTDYKSIDCVCFD